MCKLLNSFWISKLTLFRPWENNSYTELFVSAHLIFGNFYTSNRFYTTKQIETTHVLVLFHFTTLQHSFMALARQDKTSSLDMLVRMEITSKVEKDSFGFIFLQQLLFEISFKCKVMCVCHVVKSPVYVMIMTSNLKSHSRYDFIPTVYSVCIVNWKLLQQIGMYKAWDYFRLQTISIYLNQLCSPSYNNKYY